jgi:hypothetical protein
MKYKVTMTCMKKVSTSMIVEADNYDEACGIATYSIRYLDWDDEGLAEDWLSVTNWEILETNP